MNKRSTKILNGLLAKSSALRKVVECMLLAILLIGSVNAETLIVYPNGDTHTENIIIVYPTIQAAIDVANPGDTINIMAGTYTGNLNFSNKTDINITGADKNSVILKPSSVLNWDACGYTSGRKAVVRIVNSTDIMLQNLTMDYDIVKANNVFGIFGCDSTVTLNNNILKNMSVSDVLGGYSDLGTYFRAPSFTDISRANINISNNTFIDMGRVGIVVHDYSNANIGGNTFYKTTDDFGYAMEIGSKSTGIVRNNVIYGYDTPAATDGSESAGIYIESAFTGTCFGGSPHIAKNVLIENNEVYNSQLGMWIGNGYDCYSGDVDINVVLNNNSFHDNWQDGVHIMDEDKSDGSSVTVLGGGNILTNNGYTGYNITTMGDGNITVNLTEENITGSNTGIYLNDTAGGISTSSYNISIHQSNLSGNTNYGVNNTISSIIVDARFNWWGSNNGPGPVGPGSGDNVSINVDYFPWTTNIACDPVFSDVSCSHWAYSYIMYLYYHGVIGGYPDGTFGPDNTVTRAEFAVMIKNGANLPPYSGGLTDFSDVPPVHWAYSYVMAAKQAGIVGGYPDGTFRPDNNITRAEIATMTTNAKSLLYSGGLTDFSDVPPAHWAYSYVMAAKQAGIVSGYPDGTFGPDNFATRAEASVMIKNMMIIP